MSDVLRWGIIGLGVGNQHALALLADERSQLVAVCDKDPDVLQKVSARYGNVKRFTDATLMLDQAQLDAVSVASYDWDHALTIVDALQRGLHVFAEKPLGTTRADYEAIVRALDRNPDLRLSTNTLLRRSPRFEWLKAAIDRGDLGELVHIDADYLYGRLPKLTKGWRGRSDAYSVTLGGGIHMVDLLLWLSGERPSAVTAIGSAAGITRSDEAANSTFSGDCLRMGLLSFPSGMTARVSANFGSVGPHFHRVDVFGTTGTFMNLPTASPHDGGVPDSKGLLLRGPDPGTATTIDSPYPAVPKGSLLPGFTRSVLSGTPLAISEQEALDALAVCLALDESIRDNKPVAITYKAVASRR